MKIDLRQLPQDREVTLNDSLKPQELDLEVNGIKLVSPIQITAKVIKINDTVDAKINLKSDILTQCSRCLSETGQAIDKNFRVDYSIGKYDTFIDITEDIRQEIMLDYPLKPLCKSSCKGLCVKCGKNLNEGPCDCKAD